jgi:hypothetical protein
MKRPIRHPLDPAALAFERTERDPRETTRVAIADIVGPQPLRLSR